MTSVPNDNHHAELFDAAAEALILVDPSDAESVAELVERLQALVTCFEDANADHPACVAVAAAERLSTGDTAVLGEIEKAYSAARAQYERAAREHAAPVAEAPAAEPASQPAASVAEAAPKPTPATVMPLAGDEELLRDFGIRAGEHLDDADEHLIALENDPSDATAVDAVFRAFHTIKGMAGFLALDAISELSHDSESLLADARANKTAVGEVAIQSLFNAVDRMRALVFEATGVGDVAPVEDAPAGSSASVDAAPASESLPAPGAESRVEAPSAPSARVSEPARPAASSREGTVRVEEARLDALLDTIGEMVIAESMVSAAWLNGMDANAVAAQIDRLDKISRELQQMATSLRMVPLKATFRRMSRLVRDLAHKAGKQVEFVVAGEDTELDKVVVDRISDPLVHALRNAVDHGIETPQQRAAAGKPETARVELRAYHAGGAIHIEVSDDGRGLDRERILARAIERGLVAEGQQLDDSEIFDLVFEPGFSTAEVVTDVSGRGVGMDVVRRTVEELRGRIELRSTPGQGTTLSVRLPITLAIIDGMVARVGEERYIIPMLSIERSVRPLPEQVTSVAGRAEMLALDEGMLPILRLHELFDTADAQADLTQGVVVIVSDNGVRAGLLACELLGQQQTVIKPLGEGLPDQPGITGGAIMPDGRVGLILDAAGLVRLAHKKGR